MSLSEWDVDKEMLSLIKEKLKHSRSFKLVFKRNLTEQILNSLHRRMYNPNKTDHFIIVIRGIYGIGSGTGTGKTSTGIELGMRYDKSFGTHKIGFTNEELLKKIRKYAIVGEQGTEKPQVFVRDESPASLKRRSQIEFSVVQEALRDSRISLILIKPNQADLGLCHYIFEPLCFNKKLTKIRVAVVNPSTNHYRGYMNVLVHKNNQVWEEYMSIKKNFEQSVVNRQVGVFNARDYAQQFMDSINYKYCYSLAKSDGHKIIKVRRLNKYLNQFFYNLTNAERDFIIDDIKEIEEEKIKK